MNATADLTLVETKKRTIVPTHTAGIQFEVFGPNTRYDITGFDTEKNAGNADAEGYKVSCSRIALIFQDQRQSGPLDISNGLTDETLLAILDHRLKAYDNSLAKCPANTEALLHIQLARGLLQQRGHFQPEVPQ